MQLLKCTKFKNNAIYIDYFSTYSVAIDFFNGCRFCKQGEVLFLYSMC